MQIDYKLLGKSLASAELADKPVNNYSKEEIHALTDAIIKSLIPEREGPFTEKPSIENGNLHIPFNCHPRYWWWYPCGQSIAAILTELNVPDEVWGRYVDDK